MRKIIMDFIKSLRVAAVLSKKEFHGFLDVLYVNFIGTDDYFYSYLIAYNATQIFSTQQALLGDGRSSMGALLSANLRRFATKEEWVTGRWDLKIAEGLNDYVKEQMTISLDTSVQYKGYSILSTEFRSQPAIGLTIVYAKDGVFEDAFTLWHGCKSTLMNPDKDLLEFIRLLGIEDYFCIQEYAAIQRLDAFDCRESEENVWDLD